MTISPAEHHEGDARETPPRHTQHVRRLAAVLTLSGLFLLGGGYVALCALTPLPELQPTLEVAAESEIEVDPGAIEAVLAAQPLPTAIGWAHVQDEWSSDDAAYPIASLSKLVTVLVCQEAEPLAPGATGEIYTWTHKDVQRQAELRALDGVAFPIPAGTEISQRDMLALILLPSANDFAAAYAYSVFGDNESFIAAVDSWAMRQSLDSLVMVEPSGMDERNQASADDLVQIARLVLANPTLTEFTRMQEADIPGIGTITNTNPLLSDPGVIGLKTGRSSVAGYNLIAAQTTAIGGRALVKISVTLGRASSDERAAAARETLTALDRLPHSLEFVHAGERVGSVTTWTGETIPLLTDQAVGGVLVPGERATRQVALHTIGAGARGQTVGALEVESPLGIDSVSVLTQDDISEPNFWWRLSHPTILFGWASGISESTLSARLG